MFFSKKNNCIPKNFLSLHDYKTLRSKDTRFFEQYLFTFVLL